MVNSKVQLNAVDDVDVDGGSASCRTPQRTPATSIAGGGRAAVEQTDKPSNSTNLDVNAVELGHRDDRQQVVEVLATGEHRAVHTHLKWRRSMVIALLGAKRASFN